MDNIRYLLEQLDIFEENYFISSDNIELNLNLWKPIKDHNILFLTGLGGSGKTTYTKELKNKYNCEILEFDCITSAFIYGIEKLNINKIHPILLEYINANKEIRITSNESFNKESKKFVYWLLNRLKSEKKLFILEGMQIFLSCDPNMFKNKPLIILGCSMFKSFIRRLKRSNKRNKTLSKKLKAFLNDIKNLNVFINNEKQLQEFINEIGDD